MGAKKLPTLVFALLGKSIALCAAHILVCYRKSNSNSLECQTFSMTDRNIRKVFYVSLKERIPYIVIVDKSSQQYDVPS